jgi:hypothetical protein
MTDPRPHDPDARLAELLSDAVSDVEPRDSLDLIRDRTKVTRMSSRRPWIYAVGGAVVATAAVVTAIAFAGDRLGLASTDEPVPAGQSSRAAGPSEAVEPSESAGSTSGPSDAPSDGSSETPGEAPAQSRTVAAYYVGETTQGPRLFREFTRVAAADALTAGLTVLQQDPADPDYETPWAAGSFSGATLEGSGADGIIEVALADESLHDRPAGMTEEYAQEAVQQVVYTLQAAIQARAAVQFTLDGNPIDQVLGVPTSEPLANAPQNDVLALVSITAPEEGAGVSGSFTASGVANSNEANVPWQIKRGDKVVLSGFSTAEGWMDKLYPWQSEPIDVSGLAPGEYTFVAMTDDPSGGEGFGPQVDTRTIVVR